MVSGFIPVFKRDLRRYLRFKDQLFTSMLHPILWLALFGFAMAGNFERILGSTTVQPGLPVFTYLTFMCPGMIAATILFANLYGGFSVLFDKNWGILREIMASPMPRRDLVIGISLSAVTKSLIQTFIIIIFGQLLGVSLFAGQNPLQILISMAGIILFVGVFSAGVLCVSLFVAFKTTSPEGYQGITTILSMPVFFASNSLYPTNGMPPIIQEIAFVNPLTHLTNGLRFFSMGDHFSALGLEFVYTNSEILISFGYLLLFAVVMFLVAWRAIEKTTIT
jgi:ABC-2 type transport system permease protein